MFYWKVWDWATSTFSSLICRFSKIKIPFELCQSILLSSLRAWVRFSNWSCRWMFSSISVWIVSWSSKLKVCRTSRASGMKIGCLSPIAVNQTPGTESKSKSGLNRLELQGRRQMFFFPCSKAVGGNLPMDCCKIHPGFLHRRSHNQCQPRGFNKIRAQM